MAIKSPFGALVLELSNITCYKQFNFSKVFDNLKNQIYFHVWLRKRLISAGLELVHSYIEKSCIATCYRQFSTNIKTKTIRIKTVLLVRAFGPSKLYKLVLIL